MAEFDLVPCSVMMDEIALERGVRYAAKNNQMVGLCAEHVGQPEPLTAYTQLVALKNNLDKGCPPGFRGHRLCGGPAQSRCEHVHTNLGGADMQEQARSRGGHRC
jgi:hypothetical protein